MRRLLGASAETDLKRLIFEQSSADFDRVYQGAGPVNPYVCRRVADGEMDRLAVMREQKAEASAISTQTNRITTVMRAAVRGLESSSALVALRETGFLHRDFMAAARENAGIDVLRTFQGAFPAAFASFTRRREPPPKVLTTAEVARAFYKARNKP